MVESPEMDGRGRDDLREHVESIAPYYTDQWDPDSEGVGSALTALFAEMAADVTGRLDRAPEKHRVAFFDALGFDRRPPLAATLPVTFTIAEGADDNVAVEAGTEAVAAATDDRPETTFRIGPGDGFEATPARLREIYSVEPAADQLFAHDEAVAGGAESTLLAGEDRQENVLYVGHSDVLEVSGRSTVVVTLDLETSAPAEILGNGLVWEYYGERTVDGEVVEDWHQLRGPATWADHWPIEAVVEPLQATLDPTGSFTVEELSVAVAKRLFEASAGSAGVTQPDLSVALGGVGPASLESTLDPLAGIVVPFPEIEVPQLPTVTSPESVTVELSPDGPFVDVEVNGVESKWLRCRVPDDRTPTGPYDLSVERVGLDVKPAASGAESGSEDQPPSFPPDLLLANDVPQTAGDGESITPFGELPQQQDAFYVASKEAFTKKGATATLRFERTSGSGNGSGGGPDPEEVVEELVANARLDAGGSNLGTGELSTDGGPSAPAGGTGGGTSGENGEDPDPPSLSWEYWNGDGWLALEVTGDDTAQLTKGGSVDFTVPDDLEATTVAGHDGVWIRVRLVGGDYGDIVYEQDTTTGQQWERRVTGTVPRYDAVTVGYAYPDEGDGTDPAHLFAYNNREFGPDLLDRSSFRPFEPLPDDDQAIYFGFDGPLFDGPIQLFVDLLDHEYPEGFNPRVRWEYCADPGRDSWIALDGTDASEGFTEQGIASLGFPEETTAFRRFGHERHWIRARVRGDEFGSRSGTVDLPVADAVDLGGLEDALDELAGHDDPDVRRLAELDVPDLRAIFEEGTGESGEGEEACGEVVETEPPAGKPTNERPTLLGVYPNTGMAANVTVVDGEVVGSSDGSPGQSFTVSRPPVIDEEVWVDELTALSSGEREDLQAAQPDAVEAVAGPDGETRQFWVRWEEVEEFFESGADDRHYVLDPVVGEIAFGDGTDGRIPPHGRDNVRATYRTGGGPEGNVAPGAVGDLKSAIPLVDAVANPTTGAGGADAESTGAVLDRAPRELRDRGRAVTGADFERIALDASRQLARVRCLPEMNRAGEHEPGWVTLLVVPNDQRRKPTPSVGLKQQVERAVSERAPARLVARDRIEVRGPSYVAVRAEATVVAGEIESLGALEDAVDERLSSYFHPLTGGDDGDGWAFGDLPALSDAFALIEGIEGVDHVADLQLHFEGSGAEVAVSEGEPKPTVAPDALVHSGVHDVTVWLEDRTQREES